MGVLWNTLILLWMNWNSIFQSWQLVFSVIKKNLLSHHSKVAKETQGFQFFSNQSQVDSVKGIIDRVNLKVQFQRSNNIMLIITTLGENICYQTIQQFWCFWLGANSSVSFDSFYMTRLIGLWSCVPKTLKNSWISLRFKWNLRQ